MSDLKLIKPQGVQNIINKFCFTIGMIPSSYKLSLTYEEQIIAIGQYLEETVIPALNNNAEAVAELQSLFAELRNYVLNYFDNLDVQTEINNKLDTMAQSGELADIIGQYLELAGLLCFNTLNDLKNAQNLAQGSFTKTFGLNAYNDGKGEFYKIREITNQDNVDNINLIPLVNYPNLVAELMKNKELNSLIDYDIVVAKDGSGDFQTLTEAVANAVDGNKILVKSGIYENEVVKAKDKLLYIIGSPIKPIIKNSLNDYYNPPLEIAKGLVENIEFRQEGTQEGNINAYAVHIDWNSQTQNLTFNNCDFYSTKSAAVGVGLRPNYLLTFNNCNFYSENDDNMGGLFVHNSNNPDMLGNDQYIELNECFVYSQTGCAIHMQSCYGVENKAYLIAHNTYLRSFTNTLTDLIRRTLYNTATTETMLLGDYNAGNTPVLNTSTYQVDNPQLIDKFLNNQLNYPIMRVVKTLEIGDNKEGRITYANIDELFGGIINVYGIYSEKTGGTPSGLVLPLGYDNADLNLHFRYYINDLTKELTFSTSGTGDCQIIIEYWQKNDDLT